MHVADGVLSPAVCLGSLAVAAGGVGYSLYQLKHTLPVRQVPLTAMTAALIFSGQMVNFALPIPGVAVSGHLLGGLLAASLVGPWAGCVALALVLFVQMAIFADGGWLAYGSNVTNMAVVATWSGYAIYAWLRRMISGKRGIVIASVVAAWVSVLAASTTFCVQLVLSHGLSEFRFDRIFLLMTFFHSVIGLGEATITGLIVGVLASQRPEFLHEPTGATTVRSVAGRWLAAGVALSLAVGGFLAPFASQHDDGLEAVAKQENFAPPEPADDTPSRSLLSDYALPVPGVDTSSGWGEKLSVGLAGLAGSAFVFGVAWLLSRWFSRPDLVPPPGDLRGQHVA